MATTLTPNMSMPVPSVGTEAGPAYATDINNCLNILDGHDHSPGYGTPISPAGMNINADLSFGGNNATTLRSVRLSPQSAAPAGASDLGCLYELGSDLYFKDGLGNAVRITQSGAVAGTPGSIANLVSPASASYSAAAKTFTFQSAALTPGTLDAASVILRNLVASSFGMTLSPPTLTSDVTITLPPVPASNLPLSINSSGTMTAAQITLAQLTAAVQTAIAQGQTALSYFAPGMVSVYGGTTAPTGYLMCDGTAVSRTTYSALYAIIGNAYGSGDGTTTFNVPDVRGRFLRGVDGAAGRDPDTLTRTASNTGGNTGNAVGSAQADAFQTHQHSTAQPFGTSGTQGVLINSASSNFYGTSGFVGNPNTGNVSTETRPVNLYVNYIIKT